MAGIGGCDDADALAVDVAVAEGGIHAVQVLRRLQLRRRRSDRPGERGEITSGGEHLGLILLDLRTRALNGFDFLIHVRADPATRDLPVRLLPTVSERTAAEVMLSGQEPLPDRSAPRPRTSQELLVGLYALGATWLTQAPAIQEPQSVPSSPRSSPSHPLHLSPPGRPRATRARRPTMLNRAS